MIDEVDEALRRIIKREVLNGSDVEIVFEAPTKDWAARRNAPTIDVYLYDIREDVGRRSQGALDVRDDAGFITGRMVPPRYFKFSYLVTAWTQRAEDEHRLLSAVLRCFLRMETIAAPVVGGTIGDLGLPVGVRIALPPPQDRSVSDVWSALGGELKPSLDLVATVPLDTRGVLPVGPLVTEAPIIGIRGSDGALERVGGGIPSVAEDGGGRGRGRKAKTAAAAGAESAAIIHDGMTAAEKVAAAKAAALAALERRKAAAAEAAAARAEAEKLLANETVGPGGEALKRPGRVVHIRTINDR